MWGPAVCMGSAAVTLAALGGLTPNLTQVFGGVSMSMSSCWMLAHLRCHRLEWQPQATAPDLEVRVIHSQRLFLGRTEQNRRETVCLMPLLLRA